MGLSSVPGSVGKGFLLPGRSPFWPPNYLAPPASHVECWFLSLGLVLEAAVLTLAERSSLIGGWSAWLYILCVWVWQTPLTVFPFLLSSCVSYLAGSGYSEAWKHLSRGLPLWSHSWSPQIVLVSLSWMNIQGLIWSIEAFDLLSGRTQLWLRFQLLVKSFDSWEQPLLLHHKLLG